MANNAHLIVRTLKAAGIQRGFGVPSGNVLPLMEAMRKEGLPFVLTAHEGSAAFAADATGRLTRAPGLCVATLGPGATNLATGVGCAYLDRTPMIAITCTLNQAQLGRRMQMWIDHQALFKPITKASLVLRPGKIAETLALALRIATSEPPGPVHLDLPEDVALLPADEAVPALPTATPLPRASAAALEKAAQMLRAARRPVAVIGANAMRLLQPEALREFVERHGIAFASTTMAKGLVDEDHALALGCIERARRKLQREFLAGADLIVGLGYDTVEVEYEAWVGSVPVLHIDIEAADVDGSVKLAHQVVGDLDQSLTALTRSAGAAQPRWPDAEITAHRRAFQQALRPATAAFAPHQAIDVVRRTLPANGVLAFDVGAHTHQIASQWTAHAPRSFLITNGWSSMGFGLPAAIAAKMARPDLPIIGVVGDGCFQMTCGEVAVAKRERLAIPFVVLNDGWLSLIKVKQERRELTHYGTQLGAELFPPPAHYFGVPVLAVHDAGQLERALAQALSAQGPTIIDATVDPRHYSDTVYD